MLALLFNVNAFTCSTCSFESPFTKCSLQISSDVTSSVGEPD